MHELHRYRAVYWGGALFALELDVELRRAGSSLDAVLGALLRTGPEASLEDFSREVDALAGRALYAELATNHLEGHAFRALAPLLSRLGVDSSDGSARPGAVDAALRNAIARPEKN
jgi:predicted metalloprotease with PDZ domain